MFHFVANHVKVCRFKPMLWPTQIVAVKTMTFWTKKSDFMQGNEFQYWCDESLD